MLNLKVDGRKIPHQSSKLVIDHSSYIRYVETQEWSHYWNSETSHPKEILSLV